MPKKLRLKVLLKEENFPLQQFGLIFVVKIKIIIIYNVIIFIFSIIFIHYYQAAPALKSARLQGQ